MLPGDTEGPASEGTSLMNRSRSADTNRTTRCRRREVGWSFGLPRRPGHRHSIRPRGGQTRSSCGMERLYVDFRRRPCDQLHFQLSAPAPTPLSRFVPPTILSVPRATCPCVDRSLQTRGTCGPRADSRHVRIPILNRSRRRRGHSVRQKAPMTCPHSGLEPSLTNLTRTTKRARHVRLSVRRQTFRRGCRRRRVTRSDCLRDLTWRRSRLRRRNSTAAAGRASTSRRRTLRTPAAGRS